MERAYRSDAFRLDAFEPAYLSLLRDRRLAERAETARHALGVCRLCPRACEAHRLEGHVGTCGIGRHAVVSSAFPHLGEEDAGKPLFAEIARRPTEWEMDAAREAFRRAGLWRLDGRRPWAAP